MMEPYSHIYRQNQERAEQFVALVAIAWNKTLLSEEAGEDLLSQFFNKVGDPESREGAEEILNYIANFKEKYYRDDRRFIFYYELELDDDKITLHIQSGDIG